MGGRETESRGSDALDARARAFYLGFESPSAGDDLSVGWGFQGSIATLL